MRIILVGCSGKMGKAVSEYCKANNIDIAAGVDQVECDESYPCYRTLSSVTCDADVLVDFSSHLCTADIVHYAELHRIPLVLATTGHTTEEQGLIDEISRLVPVFQSSNMSVGIAVLDRLCKTVAEMIGDAADIEIIEKHHNQKLDAPSGTARMLADHISHELSKPAEMVFDRSQRRQKRAGNEIGISSIRAGSIVGEHEVIFCIGNEMISLKHEAFSRNIFAAGAMRAASFIQNQKLGKYSMENLLEERRK